jgi:type 1 glutamine amidotransferase
VRNSARLSVRIGLCVAALGGAAAFGCSAGTQTPPGGGSGGATSAGATGGRGGTGTAGTGGAGNTGGAGGASVAGGAGGSSGTGGTSGSGGSSGSGGTGGQSGSGGVGGTAGGPTDSGGGGTGATLEVGSGPDSAGPASTNVLVFSHSTGNRHESIPSAVTGLRAVLTTAGFTVEATENPSVITAAKLRTLAGVILVDTTGKPFGESPDATLAALEAFIRGGGALIGLHAASSTFYEPPVSYTRLIGGRFVEHPGGVRQANCHTEGNHPVVAKVPEPFKVRDEIYVMSNLNPDNQVVLRCEAFGNTANGLPIAWIRQEGQGRLFYTALGHENSDWTAQSPYLRDHALPGILWALGK